MGLTAPPEPPPGSVLAAFGVVGEPVLLAGGQGTSWCAGAAVLERAELGEPELAWQAGILEAILCDGFRVPRSLRAANGSLIVDGWRAEELLSGQHEAGRWRDVVAVGERLHAALAPVPRPALIADRTDAWAIADRVAWGELQSRDYDDVPHVARLTAALRPIAPRSQLVHGDLTGNVLFDSRLPPAVIDFSPYWRPAAYASAIVVADAIVREGAGAEVLDTVAHLDDVAQHLLRALIFRIVAERLHAAARPTDPGCFLTAVELACELAAEE